MNITSRLALIAALAVGLTIGLTGCTAPKEDVIRVLTNQGYSEIALTGHRFIGCGRDDTTADGFRAKSITGAPVTGVVCGSFGWGKSYTVRVD